MLSKRFLTISLVIALISMTTPIVAPMISMYSGTNNDSNAYAQSSQARPTFFIRIHPSTFEADVTHYDPREAAVPAGTTVVWVNDDELFVPHTVTSGRPGQPDKGIYFDSGEMPYGRKYELTFDSASGLIGRFPYYCTLHPWITGIISSNDEVVEGQSFEFRSGTGPMLNLTENSRTLLSFTPIGIQVDQENPLFYNFSITRDSDNETLFTKVFDVESNDFEIEVIDFAGISRVEPTTPPIWYGPDVSIPYTGAYHVAGNFFTETGNYTMTVELVRIGSDPPAQQMRDEFDFQVAS